MLLTGTPEGRGEPVSRRARCGRDGVGVSIDGIGALESRVELRDRPVEGLPTALSPRLPSGDVLGGREDRPGGMDRGDAALLSPYPNVSTSCGS